MVEKILESISDGVFTVDLDWKITYFNRAAEIITGVRREDAVGKNCCEVFKSNKCENQCPLRKTIKSGKPLVDVSAYIIDLHGRKIPISVSTALLQDESGKIIGGAETFRDLSEIEELKKELTEKSTAGEMVSENTEMRKIFSLLPAVSESLSTVLIQGETGTGKEVLAKTIHSMSPRSKGSFVAINCAALPDTLLESELFGYKKGAFTGADKDKEGRLALATKGTLFLDEIGEISQSLAVKLLRVLQEREYQPLGSNKTEKTEARIMAATNKNLLEMTKKNEFRQDLYYRLNIISLTLPPLRERKEDIPQLAEKILGRLNIIQGKNIKGFSPDVFSVFFSYDWPGNIRELENVVERAFVMCSKRIIGTENLPGELLKNAGMYQKAGGLKSAVEKAERQTILNSIRQNKGNKSSAAKQLGIDKSTLFRKMKYYKIGHAGEIDGEK
ncbi:sigma 54-interacting transcriptional regulator [candidate division WOR-3 bacterium]|nr:sigma 54-interacting transcriptional regulator [candidate division WOR-3 bacterium]